MALWPAYPGFTERAYLPLWSLLYLIWAENDGALGVVYQFVYHSANNQEHYARTSIGLTRVIKQVNRSHLGVRWAIIATPGY